LAFVGDNGGMKRSAKRPNSDVMHARGALDKHVWHFDDVPPDELEACYLFEYAREFFKSSAALQRLKKRWAKYRDDDNGRDMLATQHAEDLLRTHCPSFPPLDFDYFPQCPWQDLPVLKKGGYENDLRREAAKRVNEWSQRIRESPFDRLYVATLRQLAGGGAIVPKHAELPELLSLASSKFIFWNCERPPSDQTEYGFFLINWSYPGSQIKRAFEEWLDNQVRERKKLGLVAGTAPPSRGGFKDRLRWLGALRVKSHYQYNEMVDHADTNLKVEALYSHYPDLREAAERATQEITRMFPTNWSEAEWKRKEQARAKWKAENPHLLLKPPPAA
jgi:hypothetical protein